MKKFRLTLDDLEVTSFEVLPAGTEGLGTVRAHAGDPVGVPAEPGVPGPDTLVYTQCADPGCTPATITQCVSCDPSYCDTQCDNGMCCWCMETMDVSYCNTACPNCQAGPIMTAPPGC